eukprot:scaffold76306_cov46-Attheya_sp.AAC.1
MRNRLTWVSGCCGVRVVHVDKVLGGGKFGCGGGVVSFGSGNAAAEFFFETGNHDAEDAVDVVGTSGGTPQFSHDQKGHDNGKCHDAKEHSFDGQNTISPNRLCSSPQERKRHQFNGRQEPQKQHVHRGQLPLQRPQPPCPGLTQRSHGLIHTTRHPHGRHVHDALQWIIDGSGTQQNGGIRTQLLQIILHIHGNLFQDLSIHLSSLTHQGHLLQ